jgi:pyruvate-formate lyase-activating enzyme
MTTVEQIDQALRERGWHYDVETDCFMDGRKFVRWRKVLDLIPGLNRDDLKSYADNQYTQFCKRRVRPTGDLSAPADIRPASLLI